MLCVDATTTRWAYGGCCRRSLGSTAGHREIPTAAKIRSELNSMINQTQPGDVLFFYFAGHGIKSNHFKYHIKFEAITTDPCNSGGLIDKEPFQNGSHMILKEEEDHVDDDDVESEWGAYAPRKISYETLLQRVSSQTGLNDGDIGVHMVHLFGSVARILFILTPERLPKPLKPDQGILFNRCQPDESCHEPKNDLGGLFTRAFQKIVNKNRGANLANTKIIVMARNILEIHN